MKKYKFLEILKNIKSYMLCARGDFVEEYIEELFTNDGTVN